VTPRSSDAPSVVVGRPGRDRPGGGGNKHDKPGGKPGGKHGGKSGHGKYGGTHGHHHHASCGCYRRDWTRLLYGYFDYFGRGSCDPYDYRYVVGPTYITYADTSYLPDAYAPLPCTATGPEAWALLADGHAVAAYELFECLSRAVPDDGYLLVGLAIAAASVGEDDLAVNALRTAMRTDPVSLLDVPAGDPVDALLAAAADRYDARARGGYGDVDALFMVAAMRYLLGEDHAAHYAIEVAVTLGDDDTSTRNLKGLIEASPADGELRRPE
jgi:hypothetical protein